MARSVGKKLRILVVDDSRAIRVYIKGVLVEAFEVEVLEASSGFDALRILPRQNIDLVIADINMPDINGLELIKFIKRSERHKNKPIIVVSTQQSDKSRQRVLDLGANCFIAKPFTSSTLINTIKEILGSDEVSSSVN